MLTSELIVTYSNAHMTAMLEQFTVCCQLPYMAKHLTAASQVGTQNTGSNNIIIDFKNTSIIAPTPLI